jgi:hypothetical protein
MARISQTDKRTRTRKALDGVTKTFPSQGSITLLGKTYSHAELRALLQGQLDALDAIDAAKQSYAVAVQRERQLAPRVTKVVFALRDHLLSRHGSNLAGLAPFGFRPPRKPGPKTTAAKLHGVQKRAATRAAKGHPARKET